MTQNWTRTTHGHGLGWIANTTATITRSSKANPRNEPAHSPLQYRLKIMGIWSGSLTGLHFRFGPILHLTTIVVHRAGKTSDITLQIYTYHLAATQAGIRCSKENMADENDPTTSARVLGLRSCRSSRLPACCSLCCTSRGILFSTDFMRFDLRCMHSGTATKRLIHSGELVPFRLDWISGALELCQRSAQVYGVLRIGTKKTSGHHQLQPFEVQ